LHILQALLSLDLHMLARQLHSAAAAAAAQVFLDLLGSNAAALAALAAAASVDVQLHREQQPTTHAKRMFQAAALCLHRTTLQQTLIDCKACCYQKMQRNWVYGQLSSF
jgi:hypothetical protein